MASRKTQFGWMAAGCVVGLLGVLAISWIERNHTLAAQTNRLPLAVALARAMEHGVPANAMRVSARAMEPEIAPPPLPTDVKAHEPAPLPPPASESHHKHAKESSDKPAPPPLPTVTIDVPPPPGVEVPTPPPAGEPQPAPPHIPAGTTELIAPPPLPEPAPVISTGKPHHEKAAHPVAETAPALMPPAVTSGETLPPPLPVADSVPPPANDLKPIPQSAAANNAAKENATLPPSGGVPAPEPLVTPTVYPAPASTAPVSPIPVWESPRPMAPLPPQSAVNTLPRAPMPAPPSLEPPLAPAPGPVVNYQVRAGGETMREIARHTLGGDEHWADVHRLNPSMQPDAVITAGATVRLPADACIHDDDAIQPLPSMRPKAAPHKAKAALPLTGTFAVNLDDKKTLLLPRAIRDQFGTCDTLLVSPGSDQCLWLTNQVHLDRLADRLEHSPARELEVRTFKRLYFAQTEKAVVSDDGRITVPDKLAQFAGLKSEGVLIGIDDHFELWDAARWRQYTQQKSAAARAAMVERD